MQKTMENHGFGNHLGTTLCHLGAMLSHLGAMLAHLGSYVSPSWGLCWLMLGLCWPILGLCWPNLDAFSGLCWPMLSHKSGKMGEAKTIVKRGMEHGRRLGQRQGRNHLSPTYGKDTASEGPPRPWPDKGPPSAANAWPLGLEP